jgi:hypothetical protein
MAMTRLDQKSMIPYPVAFFLLVVALLFASSPAAAQPPPLFEECGIFEDDPLGTGCTIFSAYAIPGVAFIVDLGSTPAPPDGTEALLTGIQVTCVGICFPTNCILDATYELSCTGTPPPPEFIRGDCNNDASFNIADAIFHLFWLFASGPPPPCQNACDFDSDLGIDIADGVAMLSTLFNSGGPPAPPWPSCGVDPVAPIVVDCLNPICP